MLISALNDYYDVLVKNGKALPNGYSSVKISYLIQLKPSGELANIIECEKSFLFPKRVSKRGTLSETIEHRAKYIFGLEYDKENKIFVSSNSNAINSRKSFCDVNLKFIEDIDTPIVNAYRNFIENFSPDEQTENTLLLNLGSIYSKMGLGFAFCLENDINNMLQDDVELNKKWKSLLNSCNKSNEKTYQCSVSGKNEIIAKTHTAIKSFENQPIICFKPDSFSSYGKKQAFNSNISENVMERYTEALNYLLANKEHKTTIDDITVTYFAMDKDENYTSEFSMNMFNFDDTKNDASETEELIDDTISRARNLYVNEQKLNLSDKIKDDVDFYIFGFKYASKRAAPKFIYKQKFGKLMENIAAHQQDIQIREKFKTVSFKWLLAELKPTTSRNSEGDPALTEKIFYSIINGYDYPNALLSDVIRRIKSDSDTDMCKKISDIRVGIIKAYLNRYSRNHNLKEEFTVALNTESTNTAYLCGRLFALLEKAQREATSADLNRTIKDAYFGSACSTPAIVFPKLMKLAQYHLAKAEYGPQINYEIGQVMCKLENEFPATLSLTDQGKFILGYYQQSFKKYTKKDEINKEEN